MDLGLNNLTTSSDSLHKPIDPKADENELSTPNLLSRAEQFSTIDKRAVTGTSADLESEEHFMANYPSTSSSRTLSGPRGRFVIVSAMPFTR